MKTAHTISFDKPDGRLFVNCQCPVLLATPNDIHVWILTKEGKSRHVNATFKTKFMFWEKLKTAALLFK
jgi:hypothetical protein